MHAPMVSRRAGWARSVLASLAAIPLVSTAAPLSVVEVERVTGVRGLQVGSAKYSKDSTAFMDSSGEVIVELKKASSSAYEIWKQAPQRRAVPNIGTEAFLVADPIPYVCFKKAAVGICVVSGLRLPGGKPTLGTDKVIELARLAAAQL